jgi:hypothetical protein
MAAGRDGFVRGGAGHGLFVHQTRLLSGCRHLIDGQEPRPVGLSNVEQHSWLGYYLVPSPNVRGDEGGTLGPAGIISQQTVEPRPSRLVGEGMHEDVDPTHFTQSPVAIALALEVNADFADPDGTKGNRRQMGGLAREWREAEAGRVWELSFDYRAEHHYDRQGSEGTARIRRRLTLRVENVSSPPARVDDVISFQVELAPQAAWHACLSFVPQIEERESHPPRGCRRFGGATVSIRFYRREDGASDYEALDKQGTLHTLRQPSPWSLTATWAERRKDALTSLLPGR